MIEVLRLQIAVLDSSRIRVRVLESPVGEPSQVLASPFDPDAVTDLLRLLEQSVVSVHQASGFKGLDLEALGLTSNDKLLDIQARNRLIGQRLFDILFPASPARDHNVRAALEAALDRARLNGTALPIQLRFDNDAVDLAGLPWELVCDSSGQHLFASKEVHFTRYVTFGRTIPRFPATDRLEVLAIVPRPRDQTGLDPKAELQRIQAAFDDLQATHKMRVQMLDPPTLAKLVDEINKHPYYHIIHFDGHGTLARRCPFCQCFQQNVEPKCIDPDCPGYNKPLGQLEGCLAFESSHGDQGTHLVGATELATILSSSQVRCVVTSACQSAQIGGSSVFSSVFSSVGPSLISAGIPAVVAMQFSIPQDAAAEFVSQFYAGLARGESIASAATAGRYSLIPSGLWHIPAVYLRNPDGEGFLFRSNPYTYLDVDPQALTDFASLRPRDATPYKFLSPYEITDQAVFHGRDQEAERLLAEVLHRPYVVLSGPAGVGKTSLVNAGLSPRLIRARHRVVTIRDYSSGDPVQSLLRAVAGSWPSDVDSEHVNDLQGLIAALLEHDSRPLVVVFDAFERFLQTASADRLAAFITQFATCVSSFDARRVCLLLVIRQDALGGLGSFQAQTERIFHSVFALDWMTVDEARQAITQPLLQHTPQIEYDPAFLHDRLLPDLQISPEDKRVNPTHLQIVCSELYQAARQADAQVIGADFYPVGGARAILSRHLDKQLHDSYSEQYDTARALLREMVSPAGERIFQTLTRLADTVPAPAETIQTILDGLLKDGMVEARAMPDGSVAFSLSHPLLAAEVQSWFDREQALNGCAQATLDRAWDDWHEQWYVARQQGRGEPSNRNKLLIGPDRLREIHDRRPGVCIDGPQFCLLLRSAVYHRCDMDFWAQQLSEEPQVNLLKRIHGGFPPQASPSPAEQQSVALAAEALGLESDDIGNNALARAAVVSADGTTRHTAALALGAMGMDTVNQSQRALQTATPSGRHWRKIQALAQIKVAGFALPQLSFMQQVQVAVWYLLIRVYDARWSLTAQALGAGVGGALGLLLAEGIIDLVIWPARHLTPGVFAAMPLVGGLIGVAFGAGLATGNILLPGRTGRILGGAVGLALGALIVMPFIENPKDLLRLLPWQVTSGALAGAAIALGAELMAGSRNPTRLRRMVLGGSLGGALGFALTSVSDERRLLFLLDPKDFRFVAESSQFETLALMTACLIGATMGAAMIAGLAIGPRVWKRLTIE